MQGVRSSSLRVPTTSEIHRSTNSRLYQSLKIPKHPKSTSLLAAKSVEYIKLIDDTSLRLWYKITK